jgi:hypothetical protein
MISSQQIHNQMAGRANSDPVGAWQTVKQVN